MSPETSTSHLKVISYVALSISIAFSIVGQLLMKFAMSYREGFWTASLLLQLVFALTIYSLGVASWVIALRSVKLSIAYPLTSLNYIGILWGSYYFFNEQINSIRVLGVGLIFVGVLLVAIPIKSSQWLQR